jgi:hypothetical protein
MANTLESPHVHEISAVDGAIQVKATYTPGYTNGLVIEESWPESMGEDHSDIQSQVFDELARYRVGLDQSEIEEIKENQQWIDATMGGPSQEYTTLVAPTLFGNITRELGFALETERETADGQTTQVRHYSYPSIDRANDFMTQAFGEEGQLKFVPFEGGAYTAEEFMGYFIESRIPIATEHPYDVHDLGDHLIGWLGLDPQFIQTYQSRIAVYVERLDAEREVHPNLDLEAVNDYPLHPEGLEEAKQFFLPSLAVIKSSMRRIEGITSDVADIALTNRGVYDGPYSRRTLADVLGHKLGDAFELWGGNGPGESFPRGLLGDVSQRRAAQFGAQTYLRFQQADQLASAK